MKEKRLYANSIGKTQQDQPDVDPYRTWNKAAIELALNGLPLTKLQMRRPDNERPNRREWKIGL